MTLVQEILQAMGKPTNPMFIIGLLAFYKQNPQILYPAVVEACERFYAELERETKQRGNRK
jgi:hypothetical protein